MLLHQDRSWEFPHKSKAKPLGFSSTSFLGCSYYPLSSPTTTPGCCQIILWKYGCSSPYLALLIASHPAFAWELRSSPSWLHTISPSLRTVLWLLLVLPLSMPALLSGLSHLQTHSTNTFHRIPRGGSEVNEKILGRLAIIRRHHRAVGCRKSLANPSWSILRLSSDGTENWSMNMFLDHLPSSLSHLYCDFLPQVGNCFRTPQMCLALCGGIQPVIRQVSSSFLVLEFFASVL